MTPSRTAGSQVSTRRGGTVTRRARRHHPRERREKLPLQRDGAAPGGRPRNRRSAPDVPGPRNHVIGSQSPLSSPRPWSRRRRPRWCEPPDAGRPGRTPVRRRRAQAAERCHIEIRPTRGGGAGDAKAAIDAAEVRIDARYVQPREHHNAMEPHATSRAGTAQCLRCTTSQWVDNVRAEIAHVFGMSEDKIHVISHYVGGAFGSALRTWPHVTVAALAARRVARPVRVELELGANATPRSASPFQQFQRRIALGAAREQQLAPRSSRKRSGQI